MAIELQAQAVVAVVGAVAALVAGAFSFVNLTLNKEQKTSEFRQAWIDGLRGDLAIFFAGARAMARATEEQRSVANAVLQISNEKISDIRYSAAETRYRIQLRLNSSEAEHKELLRLMQVAIAKQNEFFSGTGDMASTLQAIDTAASYAPTILKAEWERVKRGELAFRLARNWVAPIAVAVTFVLIALVLFGVVLV